MSKRCLRELKSWARSPPPRTVRLLSALLSGLSMLRRSVTCAACSYSTVTPMFWRAIPRATDVLARPDSGDPPDAAPPLRPPRPNTSADIHHAPARALRDGVLEEHSLTKPTRSPSRPPSRSSGALRRAVEAVIAEERRSTPRHMRDVVHAAVKQDRGERGATGFSGLLKKRKSVVSLFKRHAGAADAQDGPLEGSVQPSRRCSTPDPVSVSSTSDDDRPQQLASAQPAGVVRGVSQLPSAPSHAIARHSSSSDPSSPVLEPVRSPPMRSFTSSLRCDKLTPPISSMRPTRRATDGPQAALAWPAPIDGGTGHFTSSPPQRKASSFRRQQASTFHHLVQLIQDVSRHQTVTQRGIRPYRTIAAETTTAAR